VYTQPRCTAVLCKSPLTDCYEFTALIKQFKIVSFYCLDPRFVKFNPPSKMGDFFMPKMQILSYENTKIFYFFGQNMEFWHSVNGGVHDVLLEYLVPG